MHYTLRMRNPRRSHLLKTPRLHYKITFKTIRIGLRLLRPITLSCSVIHVTNKQNTSLKLNLLLKMDHKTHDPVSPSWTKVARANIYCLLFHFLTQQYSRRNTLCTLHCLLQFKDYNITNPHSSGLFDHHGEWTDVWLPRVVIPLHVSFLRISRSISPFIFINLSI